MPHVAWRDPSAAGDIEALILAMSVKAAAGGEPLPSMVDALLLGWVDSSHWTADDLVDDVAKISVPNACELSAWGPVKVHACTVLHNNARRQKLF
jgi:hypothetical protein